MNYLEKLTPFINSNDPVVNSLALKAEVYTLELNKGNITAQEYSQLMNDLTIMHRIEESAESMELRCELNEIIKALIGAVALLRG